MELDVALKQAMEIAGAVGTCLVDYESGMLLGSAGGGGLNLEVAAAGNTDVVRAKMATMKMLGLDEKIEDMLITLQSQYHLIRPVTSPSGAGLFFYLALNKSQSNLAMARRQLQNIEAELEL
jgi:uncharacterized 2Fe-2S/4Fe-4S cluster protein (DUF4445 family)